MCVCILLLPPFPSLVLGEGKGIYIPWTRVTLYIQNPTTCAKHVTKSQLSQSPAARHIEHLNVLILFYILQMNVGGREWVAICPICIIFSCTSEITVRSWFCSVWINLSCELLQNWALTLILRGIYIPSSCWQWDAGSYCLTEKVYKRIAGLWSARAMPEGERQNASPLMSPGTTAGTDPIWGWVLQALGVWDKYCVQQPWRHCSGQRLPLVSIYAQDLYSAGVNKLLLK